MRFGRAVAVSFLIPVLLGAAPGAGEAGRALKAFEQGVALQASGRNQEAVAAFSKAIKSGVLKPVDLARALFDRGLAQDARGRTSAAIADYSAALREDGSLAAALNNRANAYRRTGRLVAAKLDYVAALNAPNAQRQYAYYGLGQVALAEHDRDGAREYFAKALAADPGYGPASEALAGLAYSVSTPPGPITLKSVKPLSLAGTAPSLAPPVLRPAIQDRASGAVSVASRGAVIQLGAFRDEASALAAWSKIATASGSLLEGLKPVVIPAEVPGKGRFWRLRTAPSDGHSTSICAQLEQMGHACIVIRGL